MHRWITGQKIKFGKTSENHFLFFSSIFCGCSMKLSVKKIQLFPLLGKSERSNTLYHKIWLRQTYILLVENVKVDWPRIHTRLFKSKAAIDVNLSLAIKMMLLEMFTRSWFDVWPRKGSKVITGKTWRENTARYFTEQLVDLNDRRTGFLLTFRLIIRRCFLEVGFEKFPGVLLLQLAVQGC